MSECPLCDAGVPVVSRSFLSLADGSGYLSLSSAAVAKLQQWAITVHERESLLRSQAQAARDFKTSKTMFRVPRNRVFGHRRRIA